ncbi:hypothetical protein MiSe_82420 [Microseira wollei NIES-4236]|uniref:Uncharacterized protein n=1 Tax=Microseira wollei NIES-4236 TaxID=2530354 RepID=A0AAV3WNL2_9CYAN|nr:hypothetical protein MiSe_82420 [Microseira wollei NIES-4236]
MRFFSPLKWTSAISPEINFRADFEARRESDKISIQTDINPNRLKKWIPELSLVLQQQLIQK